MKEFLWVERFATPDVDTVLLVLLLHLHIDRIPFARQHRCTNYLVENLNHMGHTTLDFGKPPLNIL